MDVDEIVNRCGRAASRAVADVLAEALAVPQDEARGHPGDDFLTITAAAKAFGRSHQALRNAIDEGRGPRITQIGCRIFIRRCDWNEWLRQQTRQTPRREVKPSGRRYTA